MATKLQSAMENLILVFHTYSGREGDKYKLSKLEMKNLLRGELAELLTVSFPSVGCSTKQNSKRLQSICMCGWLNDLNEEGQGGKAGMGTNEG